MARTSGGGRRREYGAQCRPYGPGGRARGERDDQDRDETRAGDDLQHVEDRKAGDDREDGRDGDDHDYDDRFGAVQALGEGGRALHAGSRRCDHEESPD